MQCKKFKVCSHLINQLAEDCSCVTPVRKEKLLTFGSYKKVELVMAPLLRIREFCVQIVQPVNHGMILCRS